MGSMPFGVKPAGTSASPAESKALRNTAWRSASWWRMVKSGRRPRWLPYCRSTSVAKPWNVVRRVRRMSGPSSPATRCRISSAAFMVCRGSPE